jgi:dTMP kinase
MKQGKFIVIDGTDGSGKGTQTDLLITALKEEGIDVVTTDFPQYGESSCSFVEKYLRGEYGTANEVSAKKASLFYALDRFDASFQMRKWLAEGKFIVSNRYVSANMGHQAGKITEAEKRDEFLEWLDELEYEILGIPRPDKTLLLYMPPEIGQKLVDQKEAREYTKGKKRDIHEADLNHLKNAADAYAYVANKFDWTTIDCAPKNNLLTREEIHSMVLKSIKDMLD